MECHSKLELSNSEMGIFFLTASPKTYILILLEMYSKNNCTSGCYSKMIIMKLNEHLEYS